MTAEVFNPVGFTYRVIAESVSMTAVAHAVVGLQTPQFRIINEGPLMVWLGVGDTQEEALANAVPVTSGYGKGLPLLPGTDEIFTFDSKRFFAAWVAKDSQYIYITSGYGM